MAKRSSVFDDVVEITSRLPWWVGVLLAVISYFGFHTLASIEVATPKNLQDMSAVLSGSIYRTVGLFGQYLAPLAFLLGAVVSAYGRWKRGRLHSRVATSMDADVLQDMSWQEFEQLVGEAFRHKGFKVHQTGGGGPDGGVDLVLSTGSEKYLVQCKQWRALKVDAKTVRELYGVMAASNASGAFVVTSGRFTRDAEKFAEGRNIELVDHEQLLALIREVRPEFGRQAKDAGSSKPSSTPSCPRCGDLMTLRTAKRGANAGGTFWGCTQYPKCTGTMPT